MNEDRLKELLDAQAATLTEHLDKRFTEQETSLNNGLAEFFGKMSRHFDRRFAEQDIRLNRRLDRIETTLDGLAERQVTDDHERVALGNQVDRHEAWIKQLAAKVGLRLSHD